MNYLRSNNNQRTGFPKMLIDDFLKENGVQVEKEDEQLEIEGEEENDMEREGELHPKRKVVALRVTLVIFYLI
jgi:hypothetical protein